MLLVIELAISTIEYTKESHTVKVSAPYQLLRSQSAVYRSSYVQLASTIVDLCRLVW